MPLLTRDPTIEDLRAAAMHAGLRVETVPDFLTNGRDDVLTLRPVRLGYLHHTVATSLESVYYDRAGRAGWPTREWRPDVPVPRCNVYAARARTTGCRPGCPYDGVPHLVFVSNGKANHAGAANLSRIQLARAGRVHAGVPDAAAAGLADDYGSAGYESLGLEIDWAEGEGWPDDLLDVVCDLMVLAVDVFDWPGLGSWIHHRQATRRKTDLAYRGDIWTLAANRGLIEEDDMFEATDRNMLIEIRNRTAHLDTAGMGAIARLDADRAASAAARAANEALVRQVLAAVLAAGVESGKRDAAILTIVSGLHIPDPQAFAEALAPLLAAQGVDLDVATIVQAARLDIAGRLSQPA